MPQVSVIIPTRNRANLLAEAIESVLNQTYSDFELVIVDDGSTDHTAEVVTAFRDQRIVYCKQEKQERGAARNKGVALSQGEFITFLDDDDWYMPRKLEIQVRELRANPDVGIVIGGWDRVKESGELVRSERPWLHHPKPALQDWLFAAMAHVAAVMIRRSWFERVGGFNHILEQSEDTYFWFRLAQERCPVAWVKEMVFRQRIHGSNSVRNLQHVKKGKVSMLETIFADPNISTHLGMSKENAFARVYMGFACLQYAANLPEDAKADLAYAVELDPSLLLNNADRLFEIVAAYAWNHLTDDPIVFTNRVFSNLPEKLSDLQKHRRAAVARTWIVGAFRSYQYKDMGKVRNNVFRAFAADPSSLLNRGLISILVRSLINSDQLSRA
ncbi:MAG: glycosyltransferase family 2 protein [Chloroflexi bacterium]|nr:MAG: glycosyltransferase family 2 protein [Chloroflexota bacterium]